MSKTVSQNVLERLNAAIFNTEKAIDLYLIYANTQLKQGNTIPDIDNIKLKLEKMKKLLKKLEIRTIPEEKMHCVITAARKIKELEKFLDVIKTILNSLYNKNQTSMGADRANIIELGEIFVTLPEFVQNSLRKTEINPNGGVVYHIEENDNFDNIAFIIENYLRFKYEKQHYNHEIIVVNQDESRRISVVKKRINECRNPHIKEVLLKMKPHIEFCVESQPIIEALNELISLCTEERHEELKTAIQTKLQKYQEYNMHLREWNRIYLELKSLTELDTYANRMLNPNAPAKKTREDKKNNNEIEQKPPSGPKR